ncbi:MAG: class 1 fructose-bisphosphatase [Gammaproteobacteria bacterium]|nr:class 1 fructose-bisphosphatase [Gammaproteobacteria bacterium]
MRLFETLENHLDAVKKDGTPMSAVAETIKAIATACIDIASLVAQGPLGQIGEQTCGRNADGDEQQALDVASDLILQAALRDTPVACLISEEIEAPLQINADAPLVVAVDPLDGSSNIETNASVGTIFSILPAVPGGECRGALQAGVNQLAAGYCIYGPQTVLVLTLGSGTQMFTLDWEARRFVLTHSDVRINPRTSEFAINASNYRYWEQSIRAYVDDCLEGETGPRGENYNMRWIASLVAECHRILVRGGVFLYPGDNRRGYTHGRLRLMYECAPIAFLIEQAGGRATTGHQRILDIEAQAPHARTPMIFGSAHEVECVENYFLENHMRGAGSQLFSQRGLFRH